MMNKHEVESKELRINIAIIICILIIMGIFYAIYRISFVNISEDAVQPRSSVMIDYTKESEAATTGAEEFSKTLNVPLVLQNPELPTGCEATALTMVLNYYGYDINKVDLVDGYLQYWDQEYQVGFKGSPFSQDGALMWPPALVDTANIFLEQMKSEFHAEDVSGKSFDELLKYIDDGCPVILWVNETFTTNINYDGTVDYYDGHTYYSQWGSHCVVLTGYDEERAVAYINNPQSDMTEIDLYQLWSVYDACGKYAVIVIMEEI